MNNFLKNKAGRIGSSEIFALIQHYLSDAELLNFGVQPMSVRSEKPFQTAFYLYHKVRGTLPRVKELPRSMGDFGLAAQGVCEKWLKEQGYHVEASKQIYSGNSVASVDFIARLDVTINQDGVIIPPNTDIIVECKTFVPTMIKEYKTLGIPFKYICQLMYQLWLYGRVAGAFCPLELSNDTQDERAYIAGLFAGDKKKALRQTYARFNKSLVFMELKPEYIALFELVLERFFDDVTAGREPELIMADEPSMLFDMLRTNKHIIDAAAIPIDAATIDQFLDYKAKSDDMKFMLDACKKKIVDALYKGKSLAATDGKREVKVTANNALQIKDVK